MGLVAPPGAHEIAVAAAAVFWSEIVKEGQRCDNGPRSAPVELAVPSLLVGIVVAAMPALTALFTSTRFRTDRPVSALVAAVVINVVGLLITALVASFVLITTAGCNRP